MKFFSSPRSLQRAIRMMSIGLMALTSQVTAQDLPIPLSERTITDIKINIDGPKTVSENRLKNFMSVKPGQKLSFDKLDDDVKRLYESGLVDDVDFLAEPNDDNGVTIIANVETRPSLQAIDFEGNTIFSSKKLRDESEMTSGGALNDAEILKGKRNIERMYQEKGFPDATVTYRITKSDNGLSTLIFQINEGIKGELDSITFTGNEAFSDIELRREMDTKEKGIFSFLTKSGIVDNNILQQDFEKVLNFYRNKGYLRAEITNVERTASSRDGMINLNVTVNEGARYTVSNISFSGMSVFTTDEIWKALTLVNGDPYSAEKMQNDIKLMRSYYGSKGYADARIIPDLQNTANNGVSINYKMTEGEKFRVGRVNIQGNNTTKDKVIRREVPLTPGEWFNSVDLDTTRNRLRNLNYFGNVQATASNSGRGGYRDVDIQVQEKATGSLGFGVGFSSIDNLVGFINLEETNFDITKPWRFKGGGQRFNTQLRLGAETADFRMSLTEPWFLGKRLALGGELYYQDRRFLSGDYDQINWGGAIFIRKPLGRRAFLRGEYRIENIELDVTNAAPGSLLLQEEGEFWRHALQAQYVYDSRDSNVTPRRGEKLEAALTYAFGDVNALTFNARATKHIQLPYDFILNLVGDVTIVEGLGDDNVPIFERTFLGGARNLRGFDFRDVGDAADGTRDIVGADPETIGGLTSAYGTIELTFPIFNTVRGAVFTDFGVVGADTFDFGGTFHSDAGAGLRLNLPFGPFAVDYAVPISHADQVDDDGRFQFYLDYKF